MAKRERYNENKFSNYYLDLSDEHFEIHEKNDLNEYRMPLKIWEYNHIMKQCDSKRKDLPRERVIQYIFYSIHNSTNDVRKTLITSSIPAMNLFLKEFHAQLNY